MDAETRARELLQEEVKACGASGIGDICAAAVRVITRALQQPEQAKVAEGFVVVPRESVLSIQSQIQGIRTRWPEMEANDDSLEDFATTLTGILAAPKPEGTEVSNDKVPANSGHGHVFKRPDGMKARCGGPGFCDECSRDAATSRRE